MKPLDAFARHVADAGNCIGPLRRSNEDFCEPFGSGQCLQDAGSGEIGDATMFKVSQSGARW